MRASRPPLGFWTWHEDLSSTCLETSASSRQAPSPGDEVHAESTQAHGDSHAPRPVSYFSLCNHTRAAGAIGTDYVEISKEESVSDPAFRISPRNAISWGTEPVGRPRDRVAGCLSQQFTSAARILPGMPSRRHSLAAGCP